MCLNVKQRKTRELSPV
ncbi:UNVERIFIED_CONTAM: hypothetical protein GTU68_032668 [Idotea baltica]|nr:hypothetical protein [Idotea baltica]